jgi:hypothetical protein
MLERIIKEELVEYLESRELIRNTQHGFRRGKSCLTNLLEFLQAVTDGIDKGELLDVLYLDFQKAFDKVPHKRLRIKLEELGIGGNLLRWIENWLNQRKQRVVLNGENSDWVKVTSGVPQGSVLGPILFVIFINDLEDGIKNRIWKFADDAKLLGRVTNLSEITELREDLDKLYCWSQKWQMTFNIDKCKVMHIGSKNQGTKYEMDNKEIKETNEEKDLGVIVCQNLKVAKQCGQAAKKGYQILGLISRAFTSKTKFIITRLYKSLVRPHLDYCIQAWRPYLDKNIEVLERVQRRATRMIDECKDLDYNERLIIAGLTTLETRRLRADLIEVFKIVKGMDKVNEQCLFNRCSGRPNYHNTSTTRGNVYKLLKKRVRLDVAKYNFGNRVVNEWNKLPDKIVQVDSLNHFKGEIDKYLRHTRGLI